MVGGDGGSGRSKLKRAREALARDGLLLQADARLPSVTILVAGEPIRGSWWGHRAGHAIFAVCEALEDDPDVTGVKLVGGKVTYVHRSLWPALLGVAAAREPWQVRGLSRTARAFLERVDEAGVLRPEGSQSRPTRELEDRLLVHSASVHTESGAHAKELRSWPRWRKDVRMRGRRLAPARAKAALEEVVARWERESGARARLPWQ
ncbi:MAG: hypothetical protein O7B99_15620 [Planctomycetota bacterium]|nr:hypothetical protein [Planctomycetota bacterium]